MSLPAGLKPCSYVSPGRAEALRLLLQPKDGQERLLRDLDVAEALHALLAFLLLLQQLALARDVAAVALGEHVLAHGAHRLARDDAAADRGLDRHVERSEEHT